MVAAEGFPGFKFGCDPELFVVDADGEYISAAGLIPGTKEEPYPVKYGAVQVDGMAAEFNIDPVDNFADFNRNISSVILTLKKMLPAGCGLVATPYVRFKKEIFDGAPDDAKVLGCTPDFNAWTGALNPPPNLPNDPTLRTASGHLHIGWRDGGDFDDEHITNCRDLVKQLDWYLGAWSLKYDPDNTRRRLYGKAGACRYKSYGVEYRVLSNFWVMSATHRQSVWNRMQKAIQDMRDNFLPNVAADYTPSLLGALDDGDKSAINSIRQNFFFPVSHIPA